MSAAAFDDLVLYLQQHLKLTIVMITHDLDSIFRTCNRVGVIVDKRMESDTLERIVDHPQPVDPGVLPRRARARAPRSDSRSEPWSVRPTTPRWARSCCW